ncbi:MAG: glycosyltransferase family 4 protein, partial [Candidatus Omnitrophota bacterium]|nr:glycosyltransferase family 4 protein [Candidatus Omnitrophota bacterium]
ELGLKDAPVVGTIGRLSQIKGQRFLVQAMAGIIARRKDAQCLIVGDGEEMMALRNLARALDIKDSVHFVSSDIDTAKFLSVMDVFVFPSVKEGLGIALLEAMAAGKACVASDIGGIRDIIKDPSCGALAAVGDIGAIAGSATAFINNKALRQATGENAGRLVARNFSLDAMGDNIIELYKEVISAKK